MVLGSIKYHLLLFSIYFINNECYLVYKIAKGKPIKLLTKLAQSVNNMQKYFINNNNNEFNNK